MPSSIARCVARHSRLGEPRRLTPRPIPLQIVVFGGVCLGSDAALVRTNALTCYDTRTGLFAPLIPRNGQPVSTLPPVARCWPLEHPEPGVQAPLGVRARAARRASVPDFIVVAAVHVPAPRSRAAACGAPGAVMILKPAPLSAQAAGGPAVTSGTALVVSADALSLGPGVRGSFWVHGGEGTQRNLVRGGEPGGSTATLGSVEAVTAAAAEAAFASSQTLGAPDDASAAPAAAAHAATAATVPRFTLPAGAVREAALAATMSLSGGGPSSIFRQADGSLEIAVTTTTAAVGSRHGFGSSGPDPPGAAAAAASGAGATASLGASKKRTVTIALPLAAALQQQQQQPEGGAGCEGVGDEGADADDAEAAEGPLAAELQEATPREGLDSTALQQHGHGAAATGPPPASATSSIRHGGGGAAGHVQRELFDDLSVFDTATQTWR